MDKLYENTWVLRIFALILALALFFYVGYEERLSKESEATAKDSVEVIENVPLEAYYDSENLIVTGLPETVNITISGPAHIALTTKLNKNFKVFVDLDDLMIGEHQVTIQHENISEKLDVSIKPASVNITIEERVTQQYKVEPEMNTTLIEEGYLLDSLKVTPEVVSITGAKSVIDSISFVKASVNGEKGIKESFEQEAPVRVLNGDLNGLDVTIEPESVSVEVVIKAYSKVIPIQLEEIGSLPEGVTLQSLKSNLQEITVYGKKAIIDELTDLVVEFDVAQLTDSGTYEVKLVLPEGVTSKTKKLKVVAKVQNSTENATETDDNAQ
ncbi:MAG: CdaR family protein [Lysinibacillus sp.]